MGEQRRLMVVLAHPDDESLGVGGSLATYAAAGVACHIVTATRGERGRFFTNENRPSDAEVGRVREGELHAAARELGARDVTLLDYLDGELDQAPPREVIGRIVAQIRRVRPQVVVTFDPFGAYGHPDHIAICQFTTAAVTAAANAAFQPGSDAPWQVAKLYYFVHDEPTWDAYQAAFKTLVSRVDGQERRATPWPDWSITTKVDTRDSAETVWRAVQCHATQLAIYETLGKLGPEHHEALWGSQTFYRVLSTVNGGRKRETDLFESLP